MLVFPIFRYNSVRFVTRSMRTGTAIFYDGRRTVEANHMLLFKNGTLSQPAKRTKVLRQRQSLSNLGNGLALRTAHPAL
jgi:hypothetical protein